MIFENLQYHGWFALSQKSPQGQIVPLHWRYHNISQGKISLAFNHSTIVIAMFILGVPNLHYSSKPYFGRHSKKRPVYLGKNPNINFCL